MSSKRMALFASMALASIALTIPATASASGTWTSGGKPLKEDAWVNLTGTLGVDFGANGTMACTLHAKLVMTAGEEGTGHFEKIQWTTETCVGTGPMEKCKLIKDEFTNKGSWMVTATGPDLDVETTFIDFKFEGCGTGGLGGTLGELTLDPDKSTEFSHLTITKDPNEPNFDGFGTLEVVGEGAGAYGVHEPLFESPWQIIDNWPGDR